MQAENKIYLKHILTLILIKQSISESFNTCNKNVLPHAIMKLCIYIHIYIGYIFLKVNTFIVFDQKTFNYENQINLQRVNTISCILFLLIYSFYSWLLNSYLFDSFPLFFSLNLIMYTDRYTIYAETCYIIKLHEHETKKQIVIHTTNNIHSKVKYRPFFHTVQYRNIKQYVYTFYIYLTYIYCT